MTVGDGGSVYVLALDESGTHGTAPALVIAGVALHEQDLRPMEAALDAVVARHVAPLGLDPDQYELHVAEIKTPPRATAATPRRTARAASPWLVVPAAVRLAVLRDAYATLATFQPVDATLPPRVFGAVVDRRHTTFRQADSHAYDHVLHRFDDMLKRRLVGTRPRDGGMVLHDRIRHKEQGIQRLAARWQRTGAGLDTLAHVPLFSDSRASRFLQAADLVASALWRYYGVSPNDPALASSLWALVDRRGSELSGVIHLTPDFKRRQCPCPPCRSRYH